MANAQAGGRSTAAAAAASGDQGGLAADRVSDAAPLALPVLDGDVTNLMQFLEEGLASIEGQTGADVEARSALQSLRLALEGRHGALGNSIALSDVALQTLTDSMDAQLVQLEASLAAADTNTRKLLGASAHAWGLAAAADDGSGGNCSSNGGSTAKPARADGAAEFTDAAAAACRGVETSREPPDAGGG